MEIQDAEKADALGTRIALLTPYTGGNLGDAAIQDSMIANLRQRMPNAQFMGATLDCDNFLKQHGSGAFPLLASTRRLSHGSNGVLAGQSGRNEQEDRPKFPEPRRWSNRIKRAVRLVPGLTVFLKGVRAWMKLIVRELTHSFEAYHFLRTQDLLIISGGGQLDEEWGGAWVFPFALFKWALLARLAGVPCAAASVGVGKTNSPTSRLFFSLALRMCCYRSYRETKSRAIVKGLLRRAANDPVVPDMAFSLPDSEFPPSTGDIRKVAGGRPVVALSPIAFGKPGNWPSPDRTLHDRYVRELARVLSCLVRRGYFPVVVCSSLGDDESVVPDLVALLDGETKKESLQERVHFPKVRTWRDFVATLLEADYLIASRLHGTILGFMTQTPTVAISFDPKVDWVMEDLDQTGCLLQIRDFTAEGVLSALDGVKERRDAVLGQIASFRTIALSRSARQYDVLAQLALGRHRRKN